MLRQIDLQQYYNYNLLIYLMMDYLQNILQIDLQQYYNYNRYIDLFDDERSMDYLQNIRD